MKLQVSSPPLAFSDRTCRELWGVDWRPMRKFCREHSIRVGHVGRRPCVLVADVLRALGASPAVALPMSDAEVIELATRRRAVGGNGQ